MPADQPSLLKEKWQGRDAHSTFGRGVALFKELLPPDNLLPPSNYMMRKVLGYDNAFTDFLMLLHLLRQMSTNFFNICRVQDPDEVEYHMCPCGHHCWPPTTRQKTGSGMQTTSALTAFNLQVQARSFNTSPSGTSLGGMVSGCGQHLCMQPCPVKHLQCLGVTVLSACRSSMLSLAESVRIQGPQCSWLLWGALMPSALTKQLVESS